MAASAHASYRRVWWCRYQSANDGVAQGVDVHRWPVLVACWIIFAERGSLRRAGSTGLDGNTNPHAGHGLHPRYSPCSPAVPQKRQNLLFSATFADEIRELATGLLNDPLSIEVAPRNSTAERIEQLVHPVGSRPISLPCWLTWLPRIIGSRYSFSLEPSILPTAWLNVSNGKGSRPRLSTVSEPGGAHQGSRRI